MIRKINNTLQTIEITIASGSLCLLLALSLFQIVFRNVFEYGFPQIDIINRHLLVICGLMGAVLASARGTHIKTDALSTVLSDSNRRLLAPLITFFSAACCAVLCYYSIHFVIDEWHYLPANERWTFAFTLSYPVCFALMSLHFITSAVQDNEVAPPVSDA